MENSPGADRKVPRLRLDCNIREFYLDHNGIKLLVCDQRGEVGE